MLQCSSFKYYCSYHLETCYSEIKIQSVLKLEHGLMLLPFPLPPLFSHLMKLCQDYSAAAVLEFKLEYLTC